MSEFRECYRNAKDVRGRAGRVRVSAQVVGTIPDRLASMLTRSIHYSSRRLRGMVVVAATICLALVSAACGDSQPAQDSVHDARLNGSVMVCPGDFRKCVIVAATVTVLSVHGETLGNAVAQQRAIDGRFSFLLTPGKYFPSASAVQARLYGGHCIAGDVIVHANKDVDDGIKCYIRVQSKR